jgi:hypothetical protein
MSYKVMFNSWLFLNLITTGCSNVFVTSILCVAIGRQVLHWVISFDINLSFPFIITSKG